MVPIYIKRLYYVYDDDLRERARALWPGTVVTIMMVFHRLRTSTTTSRRGVETNGDIRAVLGYYLDRCVCVGARVENDCSNPRRKSVVVRHETPRRHTLLLLLLQVYI